MSEQQISIVKLRDGSTIVGKLTKQNGNITVEHPIELVSVLPILPPGSMGEHINLRPWLAIAEENTFSIQKENVITIGSLAEKFIEGYNQMVQTIYFGNEEWQGDMVGRPPQSVLEDLHLNENLEDDMELLDELAQAVIDKKIH